jgi:outer membrane protein TolC
MQREELPVPRVRRVKAFAGPRLFLCMLLAAFFFIFRLSYASAAELKLQDLIDEALKKNPQILAAESGVSASRYRIPQEESLPDPMVMFGYQNDGFDKYSYGKSLMSQYMFSASQMFPFPGKLGLKGEVAAKDTESRMASYENLKLQVTDRVKELYFDLFLAYRDIDLISDKTELFSKIEDAALARYSSGKGPQEEVLMAQTEKYLLKEKEAVYRQKIHSVEAMLNNTVGRDVDSPLGRPGEPSSTTYWRGLEELIKIAYENSPQVKAQEKMVEAAETKVRLARRGYYPDFTVNAGYAMRGGPYADMWNLSASVNVPIYYRTKQRQAVYEAEASLSEAESDLQSTKLMLASALKDNYTMQETANKLMDLYRNGLIPKTSQDFELALSGYITGSVDALTTVSRLKALIDYETLYWEQFVQKEKAISRIEAITGLRDSGLGDR